MRKSAVLAFCLMFLSASSALADFYRWVDRDGNEFFTNDPKQIPAEYRDSAAAVKPGESRVTVAEKQAGPGRSPAPVSEHKDKYGKGEEYWRRKAENYRLKLRQQQGEYDLVMKQLDDRDQNPKKLTGKKKKNNASLEKKKLKLEKEIAESRRMLEVDLPEQARKADAYPGWIRE